MDWNKLKFTKLEQTILEFIFRNPNTSFNGKELAVPLKVSQTAIAKSVETLRHKGLLIVEKNILLSIKLNREDEDIFILKKIYNLRELYASGLVRELSKLLRGSSIVVFGSYSHGEDTEESDIDIAILGYSQKNLDVKMEAYEKKLQRKISFHFFKSIKDIPKNLRESIINGIILKGVITL